MTIHFFAATLLGLNRRAKHNGTKRAVSFLPEWKPSGYMGRPTSIYEWCDSVYQRRRCGKTVGYGKISFLRFHVVYIMGKILFNYDSKTLNHYDIVPANIGLKKL